MSSGESDGDDSEGEEQGQGDEAVERELDFSQLDLHDLIHLLWRKIVHQISNTCLHTCTQE